MAWFESVGIKNLRCLRSVHAALPRGLVWIRGPNGAGKTTLLEAMYLLDRGRTFRGRRGGALTTRGERGTGIVGDVVVGEGARRQRLSWDSSGAVTRARAMPLTRFVGSSSFSIVEGDPELRRRFFDWSLFHVEPDGKELWANLYRLQRQRNAWLRAGGKGRPIWDQPYVFHLEQVWRRRAAFLEGLGATFTSLAREFLQVGPLRVEWTWVGQGCALIEQLRGNLETDRCRGFTFLSSSRGDVRVLMGDAPWRGSRGQNKLVGILLQLSAQQVLMGVTGHRPVVLLDDPYAEMSGRHIEPMLSQWSRVADQIVVTSLDDVPAAGIVSHQPAVFHVEQGVLRPV